MDTETPKRKRGRPPGKSQPLKQLVVKPDRLGKRKLPTVMAANKIVKRLPNDADPKWMENMPDGTAKKRILRFYRLTLAEVETKGRVSPVRESMIRRLVWYDDTLTRLEATLQRMNGRRKEMKREALPMAKWYAQLSREMFALALALGVDLRPRRQRESSNEAWRFERVTYPKEREHRGTTAD